MPLYMEYTSLLYQGRDIVQSQSSIPPGNLITKHEDATRKEKKKKMEKKKVEWTGPAL